MSKFHGFPPRPDLQGYTAIPNVFFDEVLPNINNMSELKILLAVFRKTYGWVKEIDQNTGQPIYKLEDEISYSQFEGLTGLSSTSVATGLNRAITNGYLSKVQQGNYSGVTSAYRVTTTDGSKPAPQIPKKETPAKKTSGKPKPQYLDLGDEDVKVNKPLGQSLADLTGTSTDSYSPPKLSGEKEDILSDIFAEEKPKKKEKEKPKSPHSIFISNWFRCYQSRLNMPYGNLTGKEHGHIKGMLKEYDVDALVKAMEYYMMNYDKMDGVPNEYPNIAIFFGWRKKLIPASIHGEVKKGKRNAREFNEKDWTEGGDFFDN
jgi:hypothetical protein